MFEKELKLADRFILGETYGHSGDPTKFIVKKLTKCYATFLTTDGFTYKKRIRYDIEANEYVEWKNEAGEYYVLGAWQKI